MKYGTTRHNITLCRTDFILIQTCPFGIL